MRKDQFNTRVEELADKLAEHFEHDQKTKLHSHTIKGRRHVKHALIRKLAEECPRATLRERVEHVASVLNVSPQTVKNAIAGYGIGVPSERRTEYQKAHRKAVKLDEIVLELYEALAEITAKKFILTDLFKVGTRYDRAMDGVETDEVRRLDRLAVLEHVIKRAVAEDGPCRELLLTLYFIARRNADESIHGDGAFHDMLRSEMHLRLLNEILLEVAGALANSKEEWNPDAVIDRIEERFLGVTQND